MPFKVQVGILVVVLAIILAAVAFQAGDFSGHRPATMADLSVDEPGFKVTSASSHHCQTGTSECMSMMCEYTNHTGQPAEKMLIVYKIENGQSTVVQSERATLNPGETESRYNEVTTSGGDHTKYGCTTRSPEP